MMDGTKTTEEQPRLLDEREAAKRLRISPRGLWQLRRDKLIAWVPIGGRVLYDPSDIETFIERQRRPATAQEPAPTKDLSDKSELGA